MQKEEPTYEKYFEYLVHIWSGQTCGFTYLRFIFQINLLHQRRLSKILKVLRDNCGKKLYLWNMIRTNISTFFCIPYQSNTSPMKQGYSIHSLIQVFRKVNVLMHGNVFLATVQMEVIIFKVFILISPTVRLHMLIP